MSWGAQRENSGHAWPGKRVSLDILQEDVFAAERVYAGLASGAKSHMILQDSEIILRHRHKVVENFIGGEL